MPLAGEDEELTTVAPLRALIPDFAAFLAMPADAATTTRIERTPIIGRPLGRPDWIAMLERRLGRPFGTPQTRPKAASGAGHRAASAAAVKRRANCHHNPRMPCSWRQCVTVFTEELPWLQGHDLDLVMGRSACATGWAGAFPAERGYCQRRKNWEREHEALCNLPYERERRRPHSRQPVAARREPHDGAVRAPARAARRRLLADRPGDRQ